MLIEQAVAIMFLLNAIPSSWRKLAMWVWDSYRPELHYMRGPGPKWHAKHQTALAGIDAPLRDGVSLTAFSTRA